MIAVALSIILVLQAFTGILVSIGALIIMGCGLDGRSHPLLVALFLTLFTCGIGMAMSAAAGAAVGLPSIVPAMVLAYGLLRYNRAIISYLEGVDHGRSKVGNGS